MARMRAYLGAAFLGFAGAALTASAVEGQIPAPGELPAVEVRVTGRVMRATPDGERPVASQLVVLHRIDQQGGEALDSVTTDRAGRFALSYHANENAVHLLSARYAGIAYFSSPLGDRSAESELLVFDTTSAAIPVGVRGRHVIVSAPDGSGTRTIVEVFELANDSSVTRVAGGTSGATWSTSLPDAAQRPRVGQGDIAAAAVRFQGPRATVTAPIPPGLRQFVVSYEVAPDAFPLTLAVPDSVSVLEVLLEEEGGTVSGGGLAPRDPVTVEGREFRRSLAQNVPAAAAVTLAMPGVPATPGRGTTVGLAVAIVGVAAGVLWLLARRWRAGAAVPNEATLLAHDIAALDIAYERDATHAPDVATAYATERAKLRERLIAALARDPSAR